MVHTKPLNITFHLSEITEGNSIDLKDYEGTTRRFCNDWLSGQNEFHLMTSGSTGRPKQIRVYRNQMVHSARTTGEILELKQGDNCLVCVNTRYIAGKMMLVRAFELGLNMTITSPVSNPLKKFNVNVRFDFAAFVPYQLQTILRETPEKKVMLDRMKAIIIGGAPVSPDLEQVIQMIEAPVYSTYGMTETVSHIALRRLNGKERSEVFTALPGVVIGTDPRGCLTILGPMTNHETIITNDLVERTSENTFRFLGRVDNVINSGGVKIQVETIENFISTIFRAADLTQRFFIASVPHTDFGNIAVLMIEGERFSNEMEVYIYTKLKEKLSRYEVPKNMIFIPEFKETPTGKIDRLATTASIL